MDRYEKSAKQIIKRSQEALKKRKRKNNIIRSSVFAFSSLVAAAIVGIGIVNNMDVKNALKRNNNYNVTESVVSEANTTEHMTAEKTTSVFLTTEYVESRKTKISTVVSEDEKNTETSVKTSETPNNKPAFTYIPETTVSENISEPTTEAVIQTSFPQLSVATTEIQIQTTYQQQTIVTDVAEITQNTSTETSVADDSGWHTVVSSYDKAYAEKVFKIESGYPYYPEMDGAFYQSRKVWLSPIMDGAERFNYYAEKMYNDSAGIIISSPNTTYKEFKTEAEKYKTDFGFTGISTEMNAYREEIKISIGFGNNNTEDNIERTKLFLEFLDEKYGVKEANLNFNKVSIINGHVNMGCFQIRAADNEEWFAPKEIPSEYADSINEGLKSLDLKSYFDAEKHTVIYAEEENNPIVFAKVCKYMRENYSAYVELYQYMSSSDMYGEKIIFTKN